MSPHPVPTVTAVISTHNRCGELKTTLTRLKSLSGTPLSIIVVDNDSSDGTASWLRAQHPDITVIPHSDNAPLTGYNLGFNLVRTPYVLVLDDDSCPRPGCLEQMVALLENHPGAGALAANVIGPDGHSEWGKDGDTEFSTTWFNLIGCGFLVRQHVLIQTRGYDEAFGLYYNDLELALRILSFGHQILYSRHCMVEHRQAGPRNKPILKSRLMLKNFPLIIRNHFTGIAKLDLILGHSLIALLKCTRNGCLLPALHGAWQGLNNRSDRPFLRAPSGPGIQDFIDTFSLSRNLRRLLTPGYTATPAAHQARTIAPPDLALPLQRKRSRVFIHSPCHWQMRLRKEGASALRTPGDTPGCACSDTLSWYISPWSDYQDHLINFCYHPCSTRKHKSEIASTWSYRPTISILTPVYKVPLNDLKECLLSVEKQIYPNWELCLIEDGSGSPETRALLQDFQKRHPAQVKLTLRDDNRGIALTSQEALEYASGDYIAMLDHDDRLAPDALWEVVRHLNLDPATDWIYSDNDKISTSGERWFYHFKPDWSPDLFLCTNYALHFSVLRRSLVLASGGFRQAYEGSQDYDLYLRIADRTDRIHHIARILYSWREGPDSVAGNTATKPYVFTAGRQALADTLARRQLTGRVEDSACAWTGNYRIRNTIGPTTLDIVSPGRDVDADELCRRWHTPSGKIQIKEVFTSTPHEGGGATLARALTRTGADYLLITCADATPVTPALLDKMLSGLSTPGVAGWSAKIIRPDSTVDHCGLALAPGGKLLYPLRGLPADAPAYGAYGALPRNVSVLSPVAVVMSVANLRQVGGFDPTLETTGALIGTCCAFRLAGFRLVVDGELQVKLAGHDFNPGDAMGSTGSDFSRLVLRYPGLMVGGDPFYNLNLRHHPADFGVWHDRDNN